jgi:hypothetical protein
MEQVTLDNIGFVILAVFPGLVATQVYRLLMPARPLEWKDALLQGVFYSIVNFTLLLPVVLFVINTDNQASHPVWYWGALLLVLLVGPIAWPFVLRRAFRWKWLRTRVHLPYPTTWDYFFDSREPAFLLIRLSDGKSLGGYWGPNSYAGSFPNDGDIYLEAVYLVNSDGTFGKPFEGTKGALLRRDQYICIELFSVPETAPGGPDEQEKPVQQNIAFKPNSEARLSAPE